MTERDRLIELMMCVRCKAECCSGLDGDRCGALDNLDRCQIETIADHLIANGVIVMPCKVGDTVYCFAPCFDEMHHAKLKVVELEIVEMRTIAAVLGLNFDVDRIGKTVFPTREAAEKELERRKEDD